MFPQRIRSLVPARMRAPLLRRALSEFARDPRGAIAPSGTLLDDLVYSWGNEHWSARNEYIAGCVSAVLDAKRPVLECGSGLSTLLLGIAAARAGVALWTLEHDAQWGRRVGAELKRAGIDSVRLCVAPLKNYGAIRWYDPPLGEMPRDFGLVACDGPPGDTPGGRSGLVEVMRAHLAPGCTIMLDDGARPEETALAARWARELGATSTLVGTEKPYFRIVVP